MSFSARGLQKKEMTAILLPPQFLRLVLKRNLTLKLALDYLYIFSKLNSSFLRIELLGKNLDSDIIPVFLRFFSDQAVHSFEFRLLRSEISQANADRAKASGNLAKAREQVRRGIDDKWWPFGNILSEPASKVYCQ